jgi:hypothetical protein
MFCIHVQAAGSARQAEDSTHPARLALPISNESTYRKDRTFQPPGGAAIMLPGFRKGVMACGQRSPILEQEFEIWKWNLHQKRDKAAQITQDLHNR